jgi:hypothetical protein
VIDRGEETGLTIIEWASAILYNGAGRYSDALRSAERAGRYPEEFGLSIWALPELIEAAVRSGDADRGRRAAE